MPPLLLSVALLFSQQAPISIHTDTTVLIGKIPEVILEHQKEVDDLVRFVGKLGGINMTEIIIYFIGFGEEESIGAEHLIEMQKIWIEEFAEKKGDRLSVNTRGFHYEWTNIIQINPLIFVNSFIADHLGRKTIPAGAGFYVLGHEMMHVAFELKGIPGPLHHCLFITGGYAERLAQYVSEKNLAHPVIINSQYLETEKDWCK